jgi:hypothetical protein
MVASNIGLYDPVKNAEFLKDRKILFIVGWQNYTCLLENNAAIIPEATGIKSTGNSHLRV